MPTEATQLARTALLLIDYAVEKGMGREKLMRAAGLSDLGTVDPDSRLRTTSLLKLWRELIDGLDDPIGGIRLGMSVKTFDLAWSVTLCTIAAIFMVR